MLDYLRPSAVIDTILCVKLSNRYEPIGGHLHQSMTQLQATACILLKNEPLEELSLIDPYLQNVLLSIANDTEVLCSSNGQPIIKWGELDRIAIETHLEGRHIVSAGPLSPI